MRLKRKGLKLLAVFLGLSLVAAACGDDDDSSGDDDAASEDTTPEGSAGGDFIDLGTFVGDPPEHIDPALNSTLDAYQAINAMYDGISDIDPETGDDRAPRRRVLGAQRRRVGVDLHHPRRPDLRRWRGDRAEHLRELVGARRRPGR